MISDELLGAQIKLPPTEKGALAEFPFIILQYGQTLWRVHRVGYEPWFFGHGSRFGLDAQRGTCYLAADAMTAIAEAVIRGSVIIDAQELEGRIIRQLPLSKEFRLADTRNRKCARWGVTRELSTVDDYSIPMCWAERWADEGFDGLTYWPRFDLPVDAMNIALFGKAGTRSKWRRGRAEPLSEPGWRRRISAETGVVILERPISSEFEWCPPPGDDPSQKPDSDNEPPEDDPPEQLQSDAHEDDLYVSFPYWPNSVEKVSYTIENNQLNIIFKPGDDGLKLRKADVHFLRGIEPADLSGSDIRRMQRRKGRGRVQLIVSIPYREGTVEKISYTLQDNFLHIILKATQSFWPLDLNKIIFKTAPIASDNA